MTDDRDAEQRQRQLARLRQRRLRRRQRLGLTPVEIEVPDRTIEWLVEGNMVSADQVEDSAAIAGAIEKIIERSKTMSRS